MIINSKHVSGGADPVINPLSVTENGTYTAPEGVDGFNPVTVNVSGGGGQSAAEQLELLFAKTITIASDITSGTILLDTNAELPALTSGDKYSCLIFNIAPVLGSNPEVLYVNGYSRPNQGLTNCDVFRWTGSSTGENNGYPTNCGITINSSGNVYLHVWSQNFPYRAGSKLLCVVWRYVDAT